MLIIGVKFKRVNQGGLATPESNLNYQQELTKHEKQMFPMGKIKECMSK